MKNEKEIYNLRNVCASNLKKLIKDNGLNQSKLSKATSFSVTSINNYLNEVNDPPITFLLELKKLFNIDIDLFVTRKIKEETSLLSQKDSSISGAKYEGNYLVYFYNSNSYKGSGFNPLKDPLRYGVLSVAASNEYIYGEDSKMISFASFFDNRNQAREFKEKLDMLKDNYSEIEDLHKTIEQNYKGRLESTKNQVFIYLNSVYKKDRVYIILNNPPSEQSYIGGIGAVNSISRGREHSPIIQYIILSKFNIDLPDGEIYNLLSLNTQDIDVRSESLKLIEEFKALFLDEKLNLEEFQKNFIMQNNVEKIVISIVKRHLFRYGKISNRDDDKYYHMIKSYQK
jgi:transcriptional regulator with XRE-family HTH domain